MLASLIGRLSRATAALLGEDRDAPSFNGQAKFEVLKLAREILSCAPDRAAQILAALKRGLEPHSDEFTRFQAAEAVSMAVYPKYKFSEFARIFLEDEEFLTYYSRFMDVGNWHSLDRKYVLNELLKIVAHLTGDVAECGVYKGASAYLMCRALEGTPSLVHLFDSFEGLSEPTDVDGDYWHRGSLCASEETLHGTLQGFANYRVYKGWIPDRFNDVSDRKFRLVHVDVDLYEPTLASLAFFYPRVVSGGIVLLDDYGFNTCPGAKKAADEFFLSKPERLAFLPTGQAFTIKH